MTKHDDQVQVLEQQLLGLQKKVDAELKTPEYARTFGRLERLRAEYHGLHRRWMAAKGQTSLDV